MARVLFPSFAKTLLAHRDATGQAVAAALLPRVGGALEVQGSQREGQSCVKSQGLGGRMHLRGRGERREEGRGRRKGRD